MLRYTVFVKLCDFYRFSVFILLKNKICLFIINKKLLFNLKEIIKCI